MEKLYLKIIEEQEELERSVYVFQNKFLKLKSDYYDSIKKIPQEAHKLFEAYSNEKMSPQESIADLYVNSKDEYDKLLTRLKTYPEYIEMNRLQKIVDILEYDNSVIMMSYLKKIEEDRKKSFSREMLNKLDKLADKGWFLFYLRTPDFELHIPLGDFDNFMVTNLSRENFKKLKDFTSNFTDPGLDRNKIRLDKISDLKEVISSLEHGNLRSAARTMFSLLEHEHRSCSNIEGRSTGVRRSEEISKQVDEIDFLFLKQSWKNIDKYFKKIYSSVDNISDINRHELAHGIYNRDVNVCDVLKLIFLYVSFKELSYCLRLYFDTVEMIKRDIDFVNLKNQKNQ